MAQDAYKGWMQEPIVGTISLQHDINNATVVEIPPTLDILKNSSYSSVLVSECANITVVYNDKIIKKAEQLSDTANKVVRDVDSTTIHDSSRHSTSDCNALPALILFIDIIYLLI
jgi:hypothetical protein